MIKLQTLILEQRYKYKWTPLTTPLPTHSGAVYS